MLDTSESTTELIAAFERACRDRGLRLTHQRLEIYRELARSTDHPTAETLYKRLRCTMPTLSLDTVYRTLSTFVEYGLANKVETVESQARFEAVSNRHHHLVCSECKTIMDFQWQEIDTLPLPQEVGEWGAIGTRSVVIHGICRQCRHKT